MRFRISRKEAKECQLGLRLLDTGGDADLEAQRTILGRESLELKLILTTIVKKLE